jgi:hypothetical protein
MSEIKILYKHKPFKDSDDKVDKEYTEYIVLQDGKYSLLGFDAGFTDIQDLVKYHDIQLDTLICESKADPLNIRLTIPPISNSLYT